MKIISVTCPVCRRQFNRRLAEHNRSVKLGRREYCSNKCSGVDQQDNLGGFKGKGSITSLRGAEYHGDEFTGFKYYMRKAIERTPGSNISLAAIKEQWQKQKGKCAYTGTPLVLRNDKYYRKQKQEYKMYQMASLDRIDSNKPYEAGNIQFVSVSINLMKNTMTDADTKEFLQLIRQ